MELYGLFVEITHPLIEALATIVENEAVQANWGGNRPPTFQEAMKMVEKCLLDHLRAEWKKSGLMKSMAEEWVDDPCSPGPDDLSPVEWGELGIKIDQICDPESLQGGGHSHVATFRDGSRAGYEPDGGYGAPAWTVSVEEK